MRHEKASTPIVAEDFRGFQVWHGGARTMPRSHIHSDIEINFVLSGEVEYFFAGRFQKLKTNDLAVFWAGMPHALPRVENATEMVWCVVPLAWFLQWQLRFEAIEAFLRGQVFLRRETDDLQRALMLRWCEEFGDSDDLRGHGENRKIIALEVEALVRRVAQNLKIGKTRRTKNVQASTQASGASALQIEKLTACIARHYRDDLTIREVAQAANLHPNYAMQLFREKCGMSLWDYVLRLRVSHAQYLLLTTSRTISDIARESGFAAPSRFYAAFEKYCQSSPRAWRELMTTRPTEREA